MEELREGVNRFRKLALVLFGNVKFAFKSLSQDAERLNSWLWLARPRDETEFAGRHDAIQPLIPISGEMPTSSAISSSVRSRSAFDRTLTTTRLSPTRKRDLPSFKLASGP